MQFTKTIIAGATLALLASSAHCQTRFHFVAEPGSYAVGLKVVQQHDYARSFHSAVDDLGIPNSTEKARPLQTLIWYPAEKSGNPPMTVEDYERLIATETDFVEPRPFSEWRALADALAPTTHDALWAGRDAAVVQGQFPVVIYAPSFGEMAWENADLCEFIASHGYVVLASPGMGQNTREMTLDVNGLNAQAADITFLIGFSRTLPDTDLSKIAVVGFSWGGLSNVLAASRDSRIGALVELDGSLRYFAGIAKQAGIHAEHFSIPMLYFTQGEISLENIERNHSASSQVGPSILNRWTHGDLFTVHELAFNHTEFSSMFQRNEQIWKSFPDDHKGDYTRDDGLVGYAWMARYTWKFLDAYLKGDAAAMTFLKQTPAENGVPKHFLATEWRPAHGVPPTVDGLKQECGRVGFDHAIEIYRALQSEDKDFKPAKAELAQWAKRLSTHRHPHEAQFIWQLTASLYPESADARAALVGSDASQKENK